MQRQINVGEPTVFEAIPERSRFGVVFEDDGETGYLYGLDFSRPEQPIADALHIYNVSDANRGRYAVVTIEWIPDRDGAVLYVGSTAEAVFDFTGSRAFCRSGFPPAGTSFALSHEWDDAALLEISPAHRSE
jgi:hypothetical protein